MADYSLGNIYAAVETAMTMGPQAYSENRRVITTRPFLVKQDPEVVKMGKRIRGVATISILGDRRPYSLEVEVSIELGNDLKPGKKTIDVQVYKHYRYDERLAKILLKDILDVLEKRERTRDLIDDFRPF